jgi:CheY-like chemotaxis protein
VLLNMVHPAMPNEKAQGRAKNVIAEPNEKLKCLEKRDGFPTILVAAENGLRQRLVRTLAADGYLVLDARNEVEALHIVISHSRPIHILFADVNMNGYDLARTLKSYRPEMRALFVTVHSQGLSDSLDPETTLAKVRQLLKLPKEIAVDGPVRIGSSPLIKSPRLAVQVASA